MCYLITVTLMAAYDYDYGFDYRQFQSLGALTVIRAFGLSLSCGRWP